MGLLGYHLQACTVRESNVWKWIEAGAPKWLAVERIEVMYPPGLSDCFWTDRALSRSGWLEMKFCRIDDPVFKAGRIPKLKPSQPMFLRRQAENGVPCGIVLQVDSSEWYVWRGSAARTWVTAIQSNRAIANPDAVWRNGNRPSVEEIIRVLLPL